MGRKDEVRHSALRRIRDTGRGSRRLDPVVVAEALGANEHGSALGLKGSPATALQIRAELAIRLYSRGGRPALEGANRRVKIPVTDKQWQELEDLATSFSDLGFAPSAGQVASVLISLALPLAKETNPTRQARTRVARHFPKSTKVTRLFTSLSRFLGKRCGSAHTAPAQDVPDHLAARPHRRCSSFPRGKTAPARGGCR